MKKITILIILALILAVPSLAAAIPYQLQVFTDNPTTVDLSLLDLQVDVTSDAVYGAIFTFYNYSGTPCSITDVYFDDGALLSLSAIENGPGVSFSALANPSNVPGGTLLDPDFETTAGFSADSTSPHLQQNGVNPGDPLEWVSIKFLLIPGSDYNDVINFISTGDLRIAAHVQGFDDDSSHGVVNDIHSTPEPTTLLLLGSLATGLFGVAGVRRRRARR